MQRSKLQRSSDHLLDSTLLRLRAHLLQARRRLLHRKQLSMHFARAFWHCREHRLLSTVRFQDHFVEQHSIAVHVPHSQARWSRVLLRQVLLSKLQLPSNRWLWWWCWGSHPCCSYSPCCRSCYACYDRCLNDRIYFEFIDQSSCSAYFLLLVLVSNKSFFSV